MSGVTVHNRIASMVAGSTWFCASAARAASTAMSEVATPGAAMWRVTIPVRERIHSFDVSTSFSSSSLVSCFGGT
jgi:hypothetical protein